MVFWVLLASSTFNVLASVAFLLKGQNELSVAFFAYAIANIALAKL
jgi:hypothetical protein